MEETKLGKYRILYSNSKEYHTLKREIWGEDMYYFDTENPSPYIIDVGSHIGISVLYFKSIYPESTILSFEPNPITFEILKENVERNVLQDILLINKAVWKEETKRPFYIDSTENMWHSNSSLIENSWTSKEKTEKILIQCTKLSNYIPKEVDMLKIDIEGLELTVLKEIQKKLHMINNIAVEYHPIKGNTVKDILKILNQYFEIEMYSEGKLLKKPLENKLLTIKGKKRV